MSNSGIAQSQQLVKGVYYLEAWHTKGNSAIRSYHTTVTIDEPNTLTCKSINDVTLVGCIGQVMDDEHI